MINWNVSEKDQILIDAIAIKAHAQLDMDVLTVSMDITACHANGNPLKLAELLKADKFNFSHDIYGINANLDHDTGKLLNNFLPRYSE